MATTKKAKATTALDEAPLFLSNEDAEDIELMAEVKEAEEAAAADPIPEAKKGKKFILKEIHVDSKTILCRRVELTPSMCTARGCGFDAAIHFPNSPYKGWNDVPEDLTLRDGRTMREAVIGILQSHMDTKHGFDESHIMTEEELLRKKQESRTPGYFLTNAARA